MVSLVYRDRDCLWLTFRRIPGFAPPRWAPYAALTLQIDHWVSHLQKAFRDIVATDIGELVLPLMKALAVFLRSQFQRLAKPLLTFAGQS